MIVLTVRGLARHRWALQFLTSDEEELRRRRWDHLRLLGMASTDAFLTIPIAATMVGLNAGIGVAPWISWADTHFDFNRVELYPRMYWAMSPISAIMTELTRWSVVASALVFIVIFAPAAVSRRRYLQFGTFATNLVRSPGSLTALGASGSTVSAKATSSSLPRPVVVTLDCSEYLDTSIINIDKTTLGSESV
jgi:pheromone a factor receptor